MMIDYKHHFQVSSNKPPHSILISSQFCWANHFPISTNTSVGVTFLPLLTFAASMVTCRRNLIGHSSDICVLTDKLVNDAPKMTSSASQPDLLGGWDSWAAGNTTSMSAAASKPNYTNTGRWRNIM